MKSERNRTKPFYLLSVVCTAALGGLLFGFDIAIITGAGPYLREHFELDELSLGWAFSSLLFGCIIGSLFAGRLADCFGRKTTLLWVAALFAVTSVLTGAATSFFTFTMARCLGGLAVGGVSVVSPIYIAELSPPERRGRFGALYQMSVVTGILLSYLTNYWLRNSGPENWRWMFVTGAIPAVLLFILLLRAPETPRYLVKTGNDVAAQQILAQLFTPEQAEREWNSIRTSFEDGRYGWKHLLQPGMRRVLLLSIGLGILIHVSGVNTVIDYAPLIFQSAGWKIDAALLATFVVGVTNFVFTLASFWMIDRWGRKPLYLMGSCAMSVALFSLSMLAMTGGFSSKLVPLLIMTYLAFFASCIGPVFWTLLPEIFPNHLRGTGMTVPILTQWVANAVVVLFFPLAFSRLGRAATFGFLAAMCFLQAVFTWLYVPETKGIALEEIERLWK